MKKLVIVLTVLFAVYGCGAVSVNSKSSGSSYNSRAKSYAEKMNTPLEIGMTMDEVKELRGKSYKMQQVVNQEGNFIIWNYDNVSLTFENGILVQIVKY